MTSFHKYVRTPHIRGSRFQNGDHDLEAVPFSELRGKNLVVEEKIDGANCGISFTPDETLLLQSRGHYLRGGPREKQFSHLKMWSSTIADDLFCILGSQYVMYGEWMWAKHTYFYDALPDYFMEFDILDTETNTFLSTGERRLLLRGLPISSVHVLKEGKFDSLQELTALLGRSNFITDDREHHFIYSARQCGVISDESVVPQEDERNLMQTCDWSPQMEGLYIKWEEDGIVKGRYKYVRESFTNSIIEQDTHWSDRPIVRNMLKT